jgi:hypothetical protein
LLDAHTTATTEALLAPPEFAVDKLDIDIKARRKSGNEGDQALAV